MRQIYKAFGPPGENVTLTITPEGVEVHATYDATFGIEGGKVSWEELDVMRARVNGAREER